MLKGIGGVAGIAVLGSRRTSAQPAKDRFVVDTSTMELSALSGMEIVYDFRSVTPDGDGIKYAVVRGSESAMPDEATYAPDLTIEIETPQQQTMEMEPARPRSRSMTSSGTNRNSQSRRSTTLA